MNKTLYKNAAVLHVFVSDEGCGYLLENWNPGLR